MLVIELSKCQKILLKINNRFDIFDDNIVRYMDTNKMLSIADSLYDSSESDSGSTSKSGSSSGTDSLEVSEEDTSCDEEVEKAKISSTKALVVKTENTSPSTGAIGTSVVSNVNSHEKELIDES